MLLSSRAAGCVFITIILIMTVPSLGIRGSGRMRAGMQQVYDNRPFSAVYKEKNPDAPTKTSEGYFLGPYQPEEEHHAPGYTQQPSYEARQYPDAPEGPTDYRPDSDRPEEHRYQPADEQYSAYGRDKRRIRDAYEPDGSREPYQPEHRPEPEPEPSQQYNAEYSGPGYEGPGYKGLNSRDSYHGDSELRSEEPYPPKRDYGYDDKEQQGQYKEQDREEQHNEPRSYEQYTVREHKDIAPICLQRISSEFVTAAPDPIIQE
jgi:hypothetical protein